MERIDKVHYYLDIAKAVSVRSTCLNKHWGAVLVNNDEIVSTGYNGSPRGTVNCCACDVCYRIANNIPRGTQYESCRAIHAEANAIISAGRDKALGGTMYLYGYDVLKKSMVEDPNSCVMCRRMIINAGITTVIIADSKFTAGYHKISVQNWIDDESTMCPVGGY